MTFRMNQPALIAVVWGTGRENAAVSPRDENVPVVGTNRMFLILHDPEKVEIECG